MLLWMTEMLHKKERTLMYNRERGQGFAPHRESERVAGLEPGWVTMTIAVLCAANKGVKETPGGKQE